jgi:hypothetical protein
MPRFEIVSTPNPNSLKFTAQGFSFISEGMISASNVQQAAGNALAERLCSEPLISNVFVLPQFITVTKHASASWDDLLPLVESAILETR